MGWADFHRFRGILVGFLVAWTVAWVDPTWPAIMRRVPIQGKTDLPSPLPALPRYNPPMENLSESALALFRPTWPAIGSESSR